MALQWRTTSTTGTATFTRHHHLGRPASRTVVRVSASFINPHSILGVNATADVKDVKRAYRKLALQYHPDVCKTEDGHERFMTLTQAYEMLLGRAEGKTDSRHGASSSSSGWDFHDWYWDFRMRRTWERQQRHARAAAAAAADPAAAGDLDGEGFGSCGRRATPHSHAGYQQPEARGNLHSQLAGLRHRAAVRANRRAATATSGFSAAATATGTASPFGSASASGSWSATSGWSMDEGDSCGGGSGGAAADWETAGASADWASSSQQHHQHQQHGGPQRGPLPDWSWSWSWDDSMAGSDDEPPGGGPVADAATAAAAAAAATAEASAGDTAAPAARLHNQYTHVYDGDQIAVHGDQTSTAAANHAVPFPADGTAACPPASCEQWEDGPVAASSSAPEEEHLQEPEPFSNPFGACGTASQSHANSSRRRRFSADGATREAVTHQLTGMRRKAALRVAATQQQ